MKAATACGSKRSPGGSGLRLRFGLEVRDLELRLRVVDAALPPLMTNRRYAMPSFYDRRSSCANGGLCSTSVGPQIPRASVLRNSVAKLKLESMARTIGYARVSTSDQHLHAQLDALRDAGCEVVFEEHAGGGRWDRPELQRMLAELGPGDVVVVAKLDRLSRSLRDLLRILENMEAAGSGFRSLSESIDTTTPAGRMLASMLGAFAEFERAMIRERTSAGLAAARARGRVGGRRPKLDRHQRAEALSMLRGGRTAADVARTFGVHRSTVARLVRSADP